MAFVLAIVGMISPYEYSWTEDPSLAHRVDRDVVIVDGAALIISGAMASLAIAIDRRKLLTVLVSSGLLLVCLVRMIWLINL